VYSVMLIIALELVAYALWLVALDRPRPAAGLRRSAPPPPPPPPSPDAELQIRALLYPDHAAHAPTIGPVVRKPPLVPAEPGDAGQLGPTEPTPGAGRLCVLEPARSRANRRTSHRHRRGAARRGIALRIRS